MYVHACVGGELVAPAVRPVGSDWTSGLESWLRKNSGPRLSLYEKGIWRATQGGHRAQEEVAEADRVLRAWETETERKGWGEALGWFLAWRVFTWRSGADPSGTFMSFPGVSFQGPGPDVSHGVTCPVWLPFRSCR